MFSDDYLFISPQLNAIAQCCLSAVTIFDIDRFISDYKLLLNGLDDEAGTLLSMQQFREAKALELITKAGL